MKKIQVFTLLWFFALLLKSQSYLPAISKSDCIIKHKAYTLSYNEHHEQANWVAYTLTASQAKAHQKRYNKFIEDPLVPTGSAKDEDYLKSSYDRGHLAPAADMKRSSIAMHESFYYSNMSPQTPSFNRGVWKRLEEQVRQWAIDYDSIIIVTGPILTKGLATIGPDHVSIPKYYYKVIVDAHSRPMKGIGFILPNELSSKKLQFFVVSIDDVEKITGINFFSSFPKKEENMIESEKCIDCWKWDDKKTKNK